MLKIIKLLLMSGFLAFLVACGGSAADSSSEEDTDTNTNTDNDTPVETEEQPTVNLGLGTGTGTDYQDGVASTGLGTGESLSASGSTVVSVNLVDKDNSNAESLAVRTVYFVSTCTQAGLAEFAPAEVRASGIASATYTDKGCGKVTGATDNVVVYVGEEDEDGNVTATATARTSIDVEAARIGAIQFVSAEPDLIALNGFGTGDTPSLSNIQFQVVDESGNPMPDRTVRFELDQGKANARLSLSEAVTNQEGIVNTILKAGTITGTIRIKAETDIVDGDGNVTETITTLSTPVTMATSIADQNSSSIALSVFNPPAWDRDGETVDVTVHLGDHFQNPVIDGTTVYFRATGGIIQPSCATSNGACSVTWTSANPRPVDGIVTIVATTRGAGNYQDANSNGLFDLGESFQAYGESYVDANGNGTYETSGDYQPLLDIDGDGTNEFDWEDDAYLAYVDSSGTYVANTSSNFYEEFIDSNNNGTFEQTPAAFYQGVNCSEAALAAGHCSEQMDIVLSTRLQMSTSNSVKFEGPFEWDSTLGRFDTSSTVSCVDASSSIQTIAWRLADSEKRRNSLPFGTTIGFETDDVDIKGQSFKGDIASTAPIKTYTVWESERVAERLRKGLTPENATQERYAYLNEKGLLLTADILRPDQVTSINFLGTIRPTITTSQGSDLSYSSLVVDLAGHKARVSGLSSGSELDVNGGTVTYSLVIQNACGHGYQTGEVVIRTSNGTLSNPTAVGGVASATLEADGSITIEADSTKDIVEVQFDLASDGTPDTENNALNIEYVTRSVPIANYTVID